MFIEAVRRQRTCLSLLGALFKAAVDAHTNTVGSLPSRGDAVGVSGSSFDADDGIGHAATLGAMDPESGVTFG